MIGELQYNLVTLLTDESTHSMKITTIVDMELYSSAFWLNLIQLWQKYVSYGMFRPCLKSERNQWNGSRWKNEEDERMKMQRWDVWFLIFTLKGAAAELTGA